MNSPVEYNPYEPPDVTADPAIESSLQPWRTVVQRFRQESRALAGIPIFFACLTALLIFIVSRSDGRLASISDIVQLPGIVVSTGLLVLGVQVARRKMWAVRVLMILAYAVIVLVAASLLFFGTRAAVFAVLATAVLGFVAAQCHRVIGYARTMAAAGIPLNTKPHEITLNHLTPKVQGASDPAAAANQTIQENVL